MRHARALALALVAAAIAGRAAAADTCSVKGKMETQSFDLGSCAIAFYPGANSVTLWFTEKPLSAEALENFRRGSYADLKGTAMYFAFCPGGGTATADPKKADYVEAAVSHSSSPMLGQQWLFKKGDKSIRVEKMVGELKAGGRLTGKITGKKTLDQGQVYTWDATFDVTLPELTAAAGLVCE